VAILDLKRNKNTGADVNIRDKIYGSAPLHYAAKHNHHLIIKLLIDNGANVNVSVLLYNYSMLFMFCKLYFRRRKTDKLSPLHLACAVGYFDPVRQLIDKGANVKCRDKYRRTPLHLAAGSLNETYVAIF
jgi:ankyrin repeat protein